MRIKFISIYPSTPPGPFRKLAGAVAAVAVLALALMFSAVLLVIIALVATIAGAYLWWKTRELRKIMRDMPPRAMQREAKMADEKVFEGEVIRVVDSRR